MTRAPPDERDNQHTGTNIDDASPRRIAEEAAQWIDKLEAANENERAAFAGWLASSPRHVEEFLRMCAINEELRRLGEQRAISKASPNTQ